MMRDWDLLRVVLAVARHGGLSGAARALGVTHATVSRQLDKAEAEWGQRLFSRRPSGLAATEAGRAVVSRAEAVEAEILALDLTLAGQGAGEVGPLTVSVPPLIAGLGLGLEIAGFAADHPGVALRISASNDAADLHRREADVVLRVAHDPAPSLWGRVVARQRAGWFATGEFLEAHAPALKGTGPLSIIGFKGWENPVPKSLARVYPQAHSAIVVDDMSVAVALAEAGMGVVRMPHCLTERHPELVRVPGLPLVDYMPIWCLTHPDLREVARVRAFMRQIAQGFAARQPLFAGADDPTPAARSRHSVG